MRPARPVVMAWALLVVGGWAATLWLGEPSATAGPGPGAAWVPADEPGPQPEGSCPRATPTPGPSSSAVASLTKVPEGGEAPVDRLYTCLTVIRDHATAR